VTRGAPLIQEEEKKVRSISGAQLSKAKVLAAREKARARATKTLGNRMPQPWPRKFAGSLSLSLSLSLSCAFSRPAGLDGSLPRLPDAIFKCTHCREPERGVQRGRAFAIFARSARSPRREESRRVATMTSGAIKRRDEGNLVREGSLRVGIRLSEISASSRRVIDPGIAACRLTGAKLSIFNARF